MTERALRSQEFEAAALPHLEDVARFALHLTHDPVEADDVVQETFLRAWRGWHTFTPGTNCRSWLFTVCRNVFVRMQKKRSRLVLSEEGDLDTMPAVLHHVLATRTGVGDLFDRIDVGPAIARAVAELPEPHHSIVVLVDVEGMSYEEAAAVLDIPVGTVRSRLYRGRRKVQETLVDHATDMGMGMAPRDTPEPASPNRGDTP